MVAEEQKPCPPSAVSRQKHNAPEFEAQVGLLGLSQRNRFVHAAIAVAVAVEVLVVVALVKAVTEMTSVTTAVSVTWTVTTGGVMVLLTPAIGVAIVRLSTVSVLVVEVVAGVCRQEHMSAISEAG
jgi:hypothetical protein